MFSSGDTGFAFWLKKAWLKSRCCAWNSKRWGLRGLQVPGEVPSTAPEKTTLLVQLMLCLWQTSHQPASSSALGSSPYRNGNQHLKIMRETLKGLLINMASCKSAFYHGGRGKGWIWQGPSQMPSSLAASFPLAVLILQDGFKPTCKFYRKGKLDWNMQKARQN